MAQIVTAGNKCNIYSLKPIISRIDKVNEFVDL